MTRGGSHPPADRWRAWRTLGPGAGLVFALLILLAALSLGISDPPLVRATRVFSVWLLSLPALLLPSPAWLDRARQWVAIPAGRWLWAALLLGAILPDRLLRGSPSELFGPALYAGAALLLTADRPRSGDPIRRDLAIVALLWLPLELKWMSGDFILLRLFALDLLFLLYLIERPVLRPGRIVPVRASELAWGTGAFAVFLVPAVPFALATGFATPGLRESSLGGWTLFVLLTFWVIALPEEALFRGLMQTLLKRALGSPWWALAIASILFGLSHLNNGPAPDWRYVLLATMAGAAYGIAYLKTGNLAAPILTHFLLDLTWRGFFAG